MSGTHEHVSGWTASGTVTHAIGAVPGSHKPHYVLVDDDGHLGVQGVDPIIAPSVEMAGEHPYMAVEHDRTEWVEWGMGHRSLLYVDVTGPDGYHAQLLWDPVGYPFVLLQNGQVESAEAAR
jgi:hypothetical protein